MTCDQPPRFVIRRLHLPHCARGPARCERCRDQGPAAICLLDTRPEPPEAARPVIALSAGGTAVHRPYEVVRTFASEDAARAHASAHGVLDVEL